MSVLVSVLDKGPWCFGEGFSEGDCSCGGSCDILAAALATFLQYLFSGVISAVATPESCGRMNCVIGAGRWVGCDLFVYVKKVTKETSC